MRPPAGQSQRPAASRSPAATAASAGGVLLALALKGLTLPRGLKVFVGLIGVGILAANLFGRASVFVSVAVFVLYGIGWIALGHRALIGRPVPVRGWVRSSLAKPSPPRVSG